MTCFCNINLPFCLLFSGWLKLLRHFIHCFVCILGQLIYADKTDIIRGRVVLHAIMANDASRALALGVGLTHPRGKVAQTSPNSYSTLHIALAN